METAFLQVTSTFTSTPLETSLRAALAGAGLPHQLRFSQWEPTDQGMLPASSPQTEGTLFLVRVEDWLRDTLKSSVPPVTDRTRNQVRADLRRRIEEFDKQLNSISRRGTPTWFLAAPASGWIASRYQLGALCETYMNLLSARIKSLATVSVVEWPAFVFGQEVEDHAADRLGQIPFTQAAFDRLGQFLGPQLAHTWERSRRGEPALTGSTPLEEFLGRLGVQVVLAPAGQENRNHIDRTLRTAAAFSLTGEKRDLSEADVDRLLGSHGCLLISVSDRFSSYGPSGVVSYGREADSLAIHSFALSCPVLGKQVEYAVVSALGQIASSEGCSQLVFAYKASGRNQIMLKFLQSIAQRGDGMRFSLPATEVDDRIRKATPAAGTWTLEFDNVLGADRKAGPTTLLGSRAV